MRRFVFCLLTCLACGLLNIVAAQTELVVAADGSAKYKTVQEAIMAVPAGSPTIPVVIRINSVRLLREAHYPG